VYLNRPWPQLQSDAGLLGVPEQASESGPKGTRSPDSPTSLRSRDQGPFEYTFLP